MLVSRWRGVIAILAAIVGFGGGVAAERLADHPHRLSARAQAIIDGWRFSDDNDVSDR